MRVPSFNPECAVIFTKTNTSVAMAPTISPHSDLRAQIRGKKKPTAYST